MRILVFSIKTKKRKRFLYVRKNTRKRIKMYDVFFHLLKKVAKETKNKKMNVGKQQSLPQSCIIAHKTEKFVATIVRQPKY